MQKNSPFITLSHNGRRRPRLLADLVPSFHLLAVSECISDRQIQTLMKVVALHKLGFGIERSRQQIRGTQPVLPEQVHSADTDVPVGTAPSGQNLIEITVLIDYAPVALYRKASGLIGCLKIEITQIISGRGIAVERGLRNVEKPRHAIEGDRGRGRQLQLSVEQSVIERKAYLCPVVCPIRLKRTEQGLTVLISLVNRHIQVISPKYCINAEAKKALVGIQL